MKITSAPDKCLTQTFHRELKTSYTFAVFGFCLITQSNYMQRRYRTIPDLKVNESARTISISDVALACKLTAMGVLPGTRIEMVRTSPFGNAYYIKVDGIRIALREAEAACILLEI